MKKAMQKGVSLVLSAAVLWSLAACTTTPTDPAGSSSGQEVADDGTVSGTLEIQYFVGGYGSEWWEWIVDAFEDAYPDVEVVVNAGSDINETMTTRWISGSPPDLVYLDGPSVSETTFVEDELLLDLTDWYQTLTLEDGSLLSDNFLVEPSNYDGRVYALPIIYDNRCVWYYAAEFESRG